MSHGPCTCCGVMLLSNWSPNLRLLSTAPKALSRGFRAVTHQYLGTVQSKTDVNQAFIPSPVAFLRESLNSLSNVNLITNNQQEERSYIIIFKIQNMIKSQEINFFKTIKLAS